LILKPYGNPGSIRRIPDMERPFSYPGNHFFNKVKVSIVETKIPVVRSGNEFSIFTKIKSIYLALIIDVFFNLGKQHSFIDSDATLSDPGR